MNEFHPTPDQKRAIRSVDSATVVTAGAGTGKTAVLVGRYLELLDRGARPDQIVAITFTNKAASEMRQRLRAEIRERGAKSRPEKNRWREIGRDLETAVIDTIHGFCAGLLRRYPHLAGLDPEFTLLDEYEQAILIDGLLRETVGDFLGGRWQGERAAAVKEREALMSLLETYSLDTLLAGLRSLYRSKRRTALSWGEILSRTSSCLTEGGGPLASPSFPGAELRREVELLLHDLAGGMAAGTVFARRFEEESLALDDLLRSLESSRLDTGGQAASTIADLVKGNVPRAVRPRVERIRALARSCETAADARLEEAACSAAGCILMEFVRRLGRAKAESGELDFDDLVHRLLALLQHHPTAVEELRSRYLYYLVDEFQDTDEVQWAILQLLAATDRLFLVGDANQSIYRFRGADVGVFRRVRESMKECGAVCVTLGDSFRSSPDLLEVLNQVFRRHWPDCVPLSAHRTPDHRRVSPPVELLLIPCDDGETAGARRDREASLLAGRIHQLVDEEGWSYGDICVLCRATTHIGRLEDVFLSDGVPCHVVGGRGFYDVREVRDLRAALLWLSDLEDDLALAAVLRSPLVGLDDNTITVVAGAKDDSLWNRVCHACDAIAGGLEFHGAGSDSRRSFPVDQITEEQKVALREARLLLSGWREAAADLPLPDLLGRIVNDSGYYSLLVLRPGGERALANLDKLIDVAARLDHRMPLHQFANYLEELAIIAEKEGQAQIEDESGQVVRIMTVHQAKGLEFPVVIIPFSDSVPSPRRSQFILDTRGYLGATIVTPQGEQKRGPLFSALWDEEKAQQWEEEKRIFYVACTRARDYLILSGLGEGKGTSLRPGSGESYFQWFLGHDQWSETEIRLTEVSDKSGESGDSTAPREERCRAGDWGNEVQARVHSPLLGTVLPARQEGPLLLPVTSLVDYMHCPRLYLLRHLLGWPALFDTPAGVSSAPREEENEPGVDPLLFGTIVHEACELLPVTGLVGAVEQALSDSGIVPGSPTGEAVAGRVNAIIARFAESTLYGEISASPDIFREWDFAVPLEGPPRCAALLVGKIDAMFSSPCGHWTVVDYKSDPISPRQLEERRDFYQLQQQLYAYAAEKATGGLVDRALLHFLIPGVTTEVNVERPTLQGVITSAREAADHLRKYVAAQDFPPKETDMCSWCGYRYCCTK